MEKFYEEPQVEIIEVQVEEGFAATTGGGNDGGAGMEGDGEIPWD